jgi:hypothetical protein
MGGGSMLRLVFESETVELLLLNVPGHCCAGGKNHECCTGQDKLIECAKLGSLTHLSGFGGLGVACWPLVPKFADSNPAEAIGFLRAKKSSARLPSEGK